MAATLNASMQTIYCAGTLTRGKGEDQEREMGCFSPALQAGEKGKDPWARGDGQGRWAHWDELSSTLSRRCPALPHEQSRAWCGHWAAEGAQRGNGRKGVSETDTR